MNKYYRKIMLLVLGAFSLGLVACTSAIDDVVNAVTGECLSHGENCSSSYIQSEYGVNSLGCCVSGDVCQNQFSYSTVPTCN